MGFEYFFTKCLRRPCAEFLTMFIRLLQVVQVRRPNFAISTGRFGTVTTLWFNLLAITNTIGIGIYTNVERIGFQELSIHIVNLIAAI